MDSGRLTAEQRGKFDDIRRRAVNDGDRVSELLLAEVDSPADRVAIAEAFTPGAGAEYLS